ncbi:STAS domain-containing protein [Streptomyces sp. NPDC001904]|uniref:STAS domain-containing protein n=1 Tax=Streptomyces sp. NPDC001904 TaxID=3154531 RepID=UPI00333177BB
MNPHPAAYDASDPPTRSATLAPSVRFTDCRVVRARGELDLATVHVLESALRRARAAAGRPCLIVDLSRVTFADSSILEPLCEAWVDCRSRHGWARVVYTDRAAGLVLRISGLDFWFPAYASAGDAWLGRPARPAPGRPALRDEKA